MLCLTDTEAADIGHLGGSMRAVPRVDPAQHSGGSTVSFDPVLLDTARCLHLNAFDRSRKCVVPALLPSIFLGFRVAAPVALVITLLVEILTQVDGVGALIATAQRNGLGGQVYGLILVADCSAS